MTIIPLFFVILQHEDSYRYIALVGTRLYRLARVVPAAIELDMEVADPGPDDRSLSAVVYRPHAYDRPDAHAAGDCSL